jgi:hypothetical protein
VKQEVNDTVILSPLLFPDQTHGRWYCARYVFAVHICSLYAYTMILCYTHMHIVCVCLTVTNFYIVIPQCKRVKIFCRIDPWRGSSSLVENRLSKRHLPKRHYIYRHLLDTVRRLVGQLSDITVVSVKCRSTKCLLAKSSFVECLLTEMSKYLPIGQGSVDQMSVSKMSVSQLSVGQMCVCWMSVDLMSFRQISVGQIFVCRPKFLRSNVYRATVFCPKDAVPSNKLLLHKFILSRNVVGISIVFRTLISSVKSQGNSYIF